MKKLDFNSNWLFQKETSSEAENVNLPHDAMIHEERQANCKNGRTTGYYPGGKYVYTKKFTAPEEWNGQKILIEFEGIYQKANVSVNGKEVCFHPYGYTGFFIDLTNLLEYGDENEIKVVADNSGEPCTRWYSGSGIFRPVYLHIGNKESIRPDGVRIQTLSYDPAVLNVKTDCDGEEVHITIFDGDKAVAHSEGTNVDITVPNAKLWDERTPNLYTCRVQLYKDGKECDSASVPCGICKIEWSTKGLFVNGRETKLRGACIHHDNGVLGACDFYDSAIRRIRILKDAGFNAIRGAHNPVSKYVLEACDKLGMYIIDEFTDMWYEHKNRYDYAEYFEKYHTDDITAMVKKDYYHPCVIMYSIGNEVTETAEEWGIELTKEMTEQIHMLDNSRPVTCGINMALNTMHFAGLGVYKPEPDEPPKREQKKNPKALALLAEQMKRAQSMGQVKNANGGPAAMVGAGNGEKQDGKLVGSDYFNEAMKTMKERQRQVVTQPVAKILSEDAYAALDIAGYNYADGRYEADAVDYPDRVSVGTETLPQRIYLNWQLVKKLPYIIGDFMWSGWDYIGEAGVGSFCYDSVGTKDYAYPALLAGCGVIDITGQPRPEVWLNKAVFGLSDIPYIGVEPVTHSHENKLISAWRFSDAVNSWSWEGCEGKKAEVIVYSAAESVELIVNGNSIGKKKTDKCQVTFETVYESGILQAVAYDGSGNVTGKYELVSASGNTVLTVKQDKTVLTANGQDLCYLDICLTDENGIVKSSVDKEVEISVEGVGELAGFGSSHPFNEQSFCLNKHKTYYGRIQAVVRSGYSKGNINVTVMSEGCQTKCLLIEVK